MARDTVAHAKAEVAAALETAKATFGNSQVFGYQPPLGHFNDGRAVCVFTAAVTPTDWQIGVRIMVTASVDPKAAQDLLDAYVPAVDAALGKWHGPSAWTFQFPTEDEPFYAATNVLNVGREDF